MNDITWTRAGDIPLEAQIDVQPQLSLSFHFDPTNHLRALGNSNRWCESLDALPSFEQFLTDHPAVTLVANRAPRCRQLYYGTV